MLCWRGEACWVGCEPPGPSGRLHSRPQVYCPWVSRVQWILQCYGSIHFWVTPLKGKVIFIFFKLGLNPLVCAPLPYGIVQTTSQYLDVYSKIWYKCLSSLYDEGRNQRKPENWNFNVEEQKTILFMWICQPLVINKQDYFLHSSLAWLGYKRQGLFCGILPLDSLHQEIDQATSWLEFNCVLITGLFKKHSMAGNCLFCSWFHIWCFDLMLLIAPQLSSYDFCILNC